MDLGLNGRTALITGGSRGIGLAAAMSLASEGCALHLAARNPADLEAARWKIQAAHPVRITCHALDLGRMADCDALATACADVDILINNAGAIPGGPIDKVDDAAWRRGWELKVFGYISLTRALYARMCARGSGVIVNVIGTAGERPRPDYIAGSTANAGLMAFTRALGAEAPDHGVRVVGLNPGKTETERLVRLFRDQASASLGDAERWRELADKSNATLPFKRAARAEEVADVVVFLASARASYVSGTIVTVDGGSSLRAR